MFKQKALIGLGLLLLVAMVAGCASTTPPEPTAAPAPTSAPVEPTAAATPTEVTAAQPANPNMILATTTSTRDSGLLDVLIPIFEEQTGYAVKPIAVGSGAAMTMGEKGEADVLLVHAPDSEKEFMEAGHGVDRQLIMHNDFIIVGPSDDPAGIKGEKSAIEALKKIAAAEETFISRGDDSGTHKLELKLWKSTDITPAGQSWYQEAGQGMGATLNIAAEKKAYTISDRATYLAHQDTVSLDILVEGDGVLLNIYHVITVDPKKSDMINHEGGKAFAEFMVSQETQDIIAEFGIDEYGQPLFFPDAGKAEDELGG